MPSKTIIHWESHTFRKDSAGTLLSKQVGAACRGFRETASNVNLGPGVAVTCKSCKRIRDSMKRALSEKECKDG
jgi:hypothetical protein